jgi:hypothetical protein
MNTNRRAKLTLHRETLRLLERTGPVDQVNTSCIDSCYFVSCDGGCGISEGGAK